MSMKDDVQYECATCLNSYTPLCDTCTYVCSPSGETGKPKHYQGPRTRLDNGKVAAIGNRIALRLLTGNPVPLSWIITYNQLVLDGG